MDCTIVVLFASGCLGWCLGRLIGRSLCRRLDRRLGRLLCWLNGWLNGRSLGRSLDRCIRRSNIGKILRAKDGVDSVGLVGTEPIVWIFLAFREVMTAPVFVTPKGDLASMVRSASKVGKGSLAKVFTGRTFFAVGTKESVFTLAGGFGIA